MLQSSSGCVEVPFLSESLKGRKKSISPPWLSYSCPLSFKIVANVSQPYLSVHVTLLLKVQLMLFPIEAFLVFLLIKNEY